ncbi:MAG: hypothetical protein ACLQVD_05580 [Capsulimonadaceae bacterium]
MDWNTKWLIGKLKGLALPTTLVVLGWWEVKDLLKGVAHQFGPLAAYALFLPVFFGMMFFAGYLHLASISQSEIDRKSKSKADLEKEVMKNRKSTQPLLDAKKNAERKAGRGKKK